MREAIGLAVVVSGLLLTACATRYQYVGSGAAGDRALWECRQSVQGMTQPPASVTVQANPYSMQPGADAVARAITQRRLTDECMRAKGYERR